MTTTPPGWYDDGSGRRRWWDGVQWTDHFEPTPAAPPTTTVAADGAAGPVTPPLRVTSAQRDVLPLVPLDDNEHSWADGAAITDQETSARKRPVALLVSLGVVVLLVVVGAVTFGVVTLLGRTSGPGAAVEAMYSALLKGDCHGMEARTTQEFRDEYSFPGCDDPEAWESFTQGSTGASIKVVTTTMRDDGSATVIVELTAKIDDSEVVTNGLFRVEKVDGEWVVTRYQEIEDDDRIVD